MTENNESARGFTAPYASWGSFTNLLDRMADSGLPQRVDRTYLSSMAGSTQSHILKALRELDLMDSDDRPTDALKRLVAAQPDDRGPIYAELVQSHYAEAIDLGAGATQGQLVELFRDSYGVQGSTARKAIAFFLAAAKAGDVEVSQHFSTPKRTRTPSNGATRRTRINRTPDDTPPPQRPKATTAKDRYIDLLLKKAESEMDPELLDRIERVIGVEASEGNPTGGEPHS